MSNKMRLTREQVDRLTEKIVDKILCDEDPGWILELLERAEITDDEE